MAVFDDNQESELFLLEDIENRSLTKGKEKIEIIFYSDSPCLTPFKEQGYKQYSYSYQLEKSLIVIFDQEKRILYFL